MIDDEIEIGKLFNEYFVNIVKKIGLFTKKQSTISTENSLSEVDIATAKCGNHPSIIPITEKIEKLGNPTFGFDFNSYEKTVKQVNNLKIRKVSQITDTPVRIIKENIDIVSYFLYHNFNNSLSCSTFPTGIKYAEVTPIHKKDNKFDPENYHPISILPNLSKVYERLMYNQIYPYFLSIFQCGFRKGFNAQYCLLAMVEKWPKTLDGAVLTDLSKAFDCIDHNLLIASSSEMLFPSVTQGSVLGPLLFSIYL